MIISGINKEKLCYRGGKSIYVFVSRNINNSVSGICEFRTDVSDTYNCPHLMQEQNCWRATRLVSTKGRGTLYQITSEFKAGTAHPHQSLDSALHVSQSSINKGTIIDIMAYITETERISIGTLKPGIVCFGLTNHACNFFRVDGSVHVQQRSYEAVCQQSVVQAGGGSVMVWNLFQGRAMKLEYALTSVT